MNTSTGRHSRRRLDVTLGLVSYPTAQSTITYDFLYDHVVNAFMLTIRKPELAEDMIGTARFPDDVWL